MSTNQAGLESTTDELIANLSSQEDFLKVEHARLKLGVDAVMGAIHGEVSTDDKTRLDELVQGRTYAEVKKLADKFQKIAELLELDIYLTPVTPPVPEEVALPLQVPKPPIVEVEEPVLVPVPEQSAQLPKQEVVGNTPVFRPEVQRLANELQHPKLMPPRQGEPVISHKNAQEVILRLYGSTTASQQRIKNLKGAELLVITEALYETYISSYIHKAAAIKKMLSLREYIDGNTDEQIAKKSRDHEVASHIITQRLSTLERMKKLDLPGLDSILEQSTHKISEVASAVVLIPEIAPVQSPAPTEATPLLSVNPEKEVSPRDKLKSTIQELGDQLGMGKKLKDALIRRFDETVTDVHITGEAREGLKAIATKYERQTEAKQLKLTKLETALLTKLIGKDPKEQGTFPLPTVMAMHRSELAASESSVTQILESALRKMLNLHYEQKRIKKN